MEENLLKRPTSGTGQVVTFFYTGAAGPAPAASHPPGAEAAALEGARLDLSGPEPGANHLGGAFRIYPDPAGKEIKCGTTVLGPGVESQMGFRDDNNTTDSVRGKMVKQGFNHRRPGRPGCPQEQLFQETDIVEPRRRTGAEIGQQVAPQASFTIHAHLSTSYPSSKPGNGAGETALTTFPEQVNPLFFRAASPVGRRPEKRLTSRGIIV